jgi:hypothetical protein
MIGSLELVTWRGSRRLSCKFAIQSRVSKYHFSPWWWIHSWTTCGAIILYCSIVCTVAIRQYVWCNNLVLLDRMYLTRASKIG